MINQNIIGNIIIIFHRLLLVLVFNNHYPLLYNKINNDLYLINILLYV